MTNAWLTEFWRIAILLLGAVFFGWLLGMPGVAFTLAVIGYLFWHLTQLYRLEEWLRIERKFQPPESEGIWGDVFNLMYRSQQRNRKRKKRLAKMLQRFQQATAALPDATVVLGENNAIEWFNPAARSHLGLRSPSDVGQRIDNLLRHPEFSKFINSDTKTPLEIALPRNPNVTLRFNVTPYAKNQRLLIAVDVSKQMRLEQTRRDFVANVSHELRTPLTVVSGFLETMIDAEDPKLREWERALELMQKQAFRMQHIVEDLLLLSNLENSRQPPNRSLVDVPAMLAVIREGAEQLAEGKGHRFNVDITAGLQIVGAEKELYSAFNNLVSNAVRYTPEGGEISLRWYQDGSGIHFEVKDTGMGIAPQHIPRLTERFYRVDTARSRESGGTGLGLAIVKHVLMRHDAMLQIESELGSGSTFRCNFPLSAMSAESTPKL